MAFGFDPSIILSGTKAPEEPNFSETLQALSQLKTQQLQQQQAQATLADMMQRQQHESGLQSLLAKAGPSSQQRLAALQSSPGFYKEAMDYENHLSGVGAKTAATQKGLAEALEKTKEGMVNLLHTTTDEDDYQRRLQTVHPEARAMFPRTWAEAKPIIEALAVTPEKRAEMAAAKERAEIMASRPSYAPVTAVGEDGTPIVGSFDKGTGKVRATGFGAPPKAGGGAGGDKKEWKDLQSALSTGARGSLNKDLQKSLNSAEALEALLKLPNGQFAQATPQQMHEAYTALNNLISKGGSQAASQIEALVPETLASKWANVKQKVLNAPQSADAQAFIENVLDTAKRESNLARKQLRRQQLQSLPNFAHLRKADKARFESMLRAPGVEIDPASVDDNGLEVAAKAVTKREFSKSRNQTRLTYSDGTQEVVDGRR